MQHTQDDQDMKADIFLELRRPCEESDSITCPFMAPLLQLSLFSAFPRVKLSSMKADGLIHDYSAAKQLQHSAAFDLSLLQLPSGSTQVR